MCAEAACPLGSIVLRCFFTSSKNCGVDAARAAGYSADRIPAGGSVLVPLRLNVSLKQRCEKTQASKNLI